MQLTIPTGKKLVQTKVLNFFYSLRQHGSPAWTSLIFNVILWPISFTAEDALHLVILFAPPIVFYVLSYAQYM